MNGRIKEVREANKMSQIEFGEVLGIGQAGVSAIERGIRGITERNIRMIGKEFGVKEVWLRTGEGGKENMFTKIDSADRYSLSLGKLTLSENEFIQNAVNALAETDPDKLKIIEEFRKKCLGI